MGVASKVGDLAFKGFSAALGVTTVYLAATFSVNVYRGLAWHKEQSVLTPLSLSLYHCFIPREFSKIDKEAAETQKP